MEIKWLRGPVSGRPRVLIAEDDRDVAASMSRLFQAIEIEVTVASRSRSVVDLVAKMKPNLVIMDVMMPGLDGPAIVRLLRVDPALAATPVLLFSALDARELSALAWECGANGYMAKTAGVLALRAVVIEFLCRAELPA